ERHGAGGGAGEPPQRSEPRLDLRRRMGELGAVMRRRDFLATVGVGWFVDLALGEESPIRGSIVGASHAAGHRLRGPLPRFDGPAERAEVVIVGSGASGASAAWRLAAAGIGATLLEL